MTTTLRALCIAAWLFASAGTVCAQNFPVRPVRIIVPATPGNPSDIIARIIGAKLSELWGQSVVYENRPGGGGTLGIAQAAKAAPDGYAHCVDATRALARACVAWARASART